MGGRAKSGGDWQNPPGSRHGSVAQAQAHQAGFRSPAADSECPDGQDRRTVNHVRKELYEFFVDVRPLEDFRGAICGGTYDRDMMKEAGMISTVYAVNIGLLAERRHLYENAVAEAQSK